MIEERMHYNSFDIVLKAPVQNCIFAKLDLLTESTGNARQGSRHREAVCMVWPNFCEEDYDDVKQL